MKGNTVRDIKVGDTVRLIGRANSMVVRQLTRDEKHAVCEYSRAGQEVFRTFVIVADLEKCAAGISY